MRIYSHLSCLKHDVPPVRGLAPARLETIEAVLHEIKGVSWKQASPADRAVIELLHTPDYIDKVLSLIPEGQDVAFDFETFAMSHTAEALLAATGQVIEAVRDVVSGETHSAFCLISPGGHHAEADLAQGYCFFNHVALGAVFAQQKLGLKRVAVLDFDVHHGNGTQSFFWNHEDRLYVSLHEDTPLSGFADEKGAWDNVMNIPLPTASSGDAFRSAITEYALPKIGSFHPDILFLSAGFDMHKDDILGSLRLDVPDYAWLGQQLRVFTKEKCQNRLVAVLEGGYNLDVLAPSVAAFVQGLVGEKE